jgi:hypothetical protein
MSYATYGALKTALGNEHARADITSARYDDLIQRAETRMNRVCAALGAGELQSTSITVSGEFTDLPATYNTMRLLAIDGASRTTTLQYYPPERLLQEYPALANSQPRGFSVVGKGDGTDVMRLWVRPLPDASYAMRALYYVKLTTLVGSDANVNWMLLNNPDAYVYAFMVELGLASNDAGMAQRYSTALQQAIEDMKARDKDRRWGGGALRMRPNILLQKGN